MKVRDVMSSPVITVTPETPFTDVVDLLLEHEISGVPVVDENERLIGIITEADLVSKEAYGYARRRPLGLVADYLRGRDPQWVRKGAGRQAQDVMGRLVVTVSPDADVAVAARRMLEQHRKRLPVVDDGRLVGIVARSDLLRPFLRSDDEILSDIEALLASPLRVPETHEANVSVSSGIVTLSGSALWPTDVALLGAVVGRVPGVVAVENHVEAREPDPRSTGVHPVG